MVVYIGTQIYKKVFTRRSSRSSNNNDLGNKANLEE